MGRLLKKLGVVVASVAAAATMSIAGSAPAQASPPLWGGPWNFITIYNQQCMVLDNAHVPGTVHWAGCSSLPQYGHNWYVEDLGSAGPGGREWIRIWWGGMRSGACLIPNWEYEGAPVVVTTGVCNNSAARWAWWPSSAGGSYAELVNGANSNLVLDYDISSANRGLQLYHAVYDDNQRFYFGL